MTPKLDTEMFVPLLGRITWGHGAEKTLDFNFAILQLFIANVFKC